MSDQNLSNQHHDSQEELHTGLKIVSFCFPIVGAILYFVNKDKYPKKAKSACTLALWGFGIGILINIIITVLGGAAAFLGGGY